MKMSTTTLLRKFSASLVLMIAAALVVIASPVIVSAHELHNKINELEKQIEANRSQAEALGQRANTLQNRVNGLQAQIRTIQKQIDLSQAKYKKLQHEIEDTEKKIDERTDFLGKNLAAIYVESSMSPIEMVASSGTLGDYIDKQEYRSVVRDKVHNAINEVKELKEKLQKKQAQVKQVLKEQKSQRANLASKKSEVSKLLAQTRGEESKYRVLVKDLQKQKAKAEAALAASLSSGSYKAAPVGPVSAGDVIGSVGNTGLSSGPHLHLEVRSGGGAINPGSSIRVSPVPMSRAYISQGFGANPQFYGAGGHPGIDYAAAPGTPIRAINSGYMYRGCSANLLGTNAYGYVAIVEHANGTVSIYAHMGGAPAACNFNIYANI